MQIFTCSPWRRPIPEQMDACEEAVTLWETHAKRSLDHSCLYLKSCILWKNDSLFLIKCKMFNNFLFSYLLLLLPIQLPIYCKIVMEWHCNTLNINVFPQQYEILYHSYLLDSPKRENTHNHVVLSLQMPHSVFLEDIYVYPNYYGLKSPYSSCFITFFQKYLTVMYFYLQINYHFFFPELNYSKFSSL